MSSIQKGLRRAGVGGLSAILATTAMTGFASMASATSTFAFDRVQGSDRYVTSVATAKVFPASTNVILASGEKGHFPDALAASYLAGRKSAPVMLTKQATTPPAIAAQIALRGTKNIWIVGGTDVVSAAQEATLAKTYTVKRLGGSDRFVTAAAVIADGGAATTTTAILATGRNFPDALGGGALSYAKKMPLAITQTNILPTETLAALKVAGTTHVIILGGPDVVGVNVVTMLTAAGITSQRIFGVDRADTSAALAEYELTQGFSATAVNVASGYTVGDGVDALGGAALSGQEARPLLITDDQTRIGTKLEAYLKDHAATLTEGHIFGGLDALSQKSENTMTADARGVVVNQAFTVTGGALTQATKTSRTYTVTGLTVGTAINIDLVDAAQISGSTFALASGNRTAALAFTPSVSDVAIDAINGVPVNATLAKAFTPTATSLTFTVDSLTANGTQAVPVVFKGATNVLNVNLNGVPTTQAFGIGGMITFEAAAATPPAEAASGAIASAAVTAVFGATGFSTTVTTTQFVMRAGDTYQFGGTGISMAQFQSILSVGDTVSGTYVKGSTVTTPSTFNITTDLPLVAVAPSATPLGSAVTVTYTPDSSISANGTTVTLQRAKVVSGITGPFATVKTGTISSLSEQTFTETLADGDYQYQLIYTAPAFSGTAAVTSAVGTVTVTSAATALAPTIQRVYLTSNASAIATLSSGDVFKVATNAPMVQPVVGATLTVGGKTLTNSAATATAAGSATFTVNTSVEVVDGVSHAAGTVLTVKLLADTIGGNVAFATSVDASTGIANATGALTGFGANSTLTQDVVS